MSEWTFVIAAYAAAWAGIVGYGVWLAVLNRRAGALARGAGRDA